MFDVCQDRGLVLVELADGVSLEDVRAATGSAFEVSHVLCMCVCLSVCTVHV